MMQGINGPFPYCVTKSKAIIPARVDVFVMTNRIINLQGSGFRTVSKV